MRRITSRSLAQVGHFADKMLGAKLITKQTGSTGLPCSAVCGGAVVTLPNRCAGAGRGEAQDRQGILLCHPDGPHAPGAAIWAELGCVTAPQGPVVVASTQGGMNIEEVAARDPQAILKFPVSLEHGLPKAHAQPFTPQQA